MFLSSVDHWLPIVEEMNKIQMWVPDKAVYDYYFDKIPKGNQYLNFIKKDKKEAKERKKKLEKIKNEYNVSEREASLILVFKERLKL